MGTMKLTSYQLLIAETNKRMIKMPKDRRELSYEARVKSHLLDLADLSLELRRDSNEWKWCFYIACTTIFFQIVLWLSEGDKLGIGPLFDEVLK